jgi:hypothetical protein
MKNNGKVILDLCGGTGAWSEPYRKAGYLVHNVTLPEWDVREHIFDAEMGTLEFQSQINEKLVLRVHLNAIHGILAAPPCTEFSLAKTTKPRDFEKGIDVVAGCMRIIWGCRALGQLEWWALENPRGFLRQFMGNPAYSFKQWWFGGNRTKPTDLWGYFTKPRRTVMSEPIFLQKTNNGVRKRDGKKLEHRNAAWYANATPAQRAITPAGFSKAFFKANP